jgi:hypothetical protein
MRYTDYVFILAGAVCLIISLVRMNAIQSHLIRVLGVVILGFGIVRALTATPVRGPHLFLLLASAVLVLGSYLASLRRQIRRARRNDPRRYRDHLESATAILWLGWTLVFMSLLARAFQVLFLEPAWFSGVLMLGVYLWVRLSVGLEEGEGEPATEPEG